MPINKNDSDQSNHFFDKQRYIYSYTMAVRDFADIYTQSLRAEGVYISKIPSSPDIN